MTPNEYRKKHKRCATGAYWRREYTPYFAEIECGKCKIKNTNKSDWNGRFCRLYRAEEFKE